MLSLPSENWNHPNTGCLICLIIIILIIITLLEKDKQYCWQFIVVIIASLVYKVGLMRECRGQWSVVSYVFPQTIESPVHDHMNPGQDVIDPCCVRLKIKIGLIIICFEWKIFGSMVFNGNWVFFCFLSWFVTIGPSVCDGSAREALIGQQLKTRKLTQP